MNARGEADSRRRDLGGLKRLIAAVYSLANRRGPGRSGIAHCRRWRLAGAILCAALPLVALAAQAPSAAPQDTASQNAVAPAESPGKPEQPRPALSGQLAGGGEVAGQLLALDAQGIVHLEQQGKTHRVPLADLAWWGRLSPLPRSCLVLLADGSVLPADLVESDAEHLVVDSRAWGELQIPLERLAGLVLHPPADPLRRDLLLDRVLKAAGDADRLLVDNGDELSGTLQALDDRNAELQTAGNSVKLPTERLMAVIYNPTLRDRRLPPEPRLWLGLNDGTRLLAEQVEAASGRLSCRLIDRQSWSTELTRLVLLQPQGGRVQYLSDLAPAGYRHVPYLDLPWSYQLDRNVLGGRLRALGQEFLRGVGLHSASRLTFALSGQQQFAAEAALDSQTGGRGSVVFRVFVDTELKFTSPVVRGHDAPLPIRIDLPATARSLSLIVDFAERGDEQDHANWLNARLISAP